MEKLADVTSDAVVLLGHLLQNLTVEDIDLLKSEDYPHLIASAFSRFGDEEWRHFESFVSIEWTKEAYDELARNEYGKAYDEYLNNRRTYSLEELKSAQGADEFYERLMGYIAACAPHISYALEK